MDLPNSLIELSIDRGAILHSSIFVNIDHPKFFVVIGVDEDNIAGFFYINSRINENVIKAKTEQWRMQYLINNKDYSFLDHDSYICASDIKIISRNSIVESVINGITKKVGNLKEDHLEDLLEMVRNSKLFSKIEKDKYFK